MNITITDTYRAGIAGCNTEIKRYEALINRYSVLRLLVIGAGIFLFYQSLKPEQTWIPVLVLFTVVFIFSLLVRQQNRFEKKRDYYRDLGAVCQNENDSIDDRKNIYKDGSEWIDELHPYSSDLDIYGKRSLYELINRCATSLGSAKLAEWLGMRSSAVVIRERQAAVKELSEKQNWKFNFQAVLLFCNRDKEDQIQNIFRYLRSAPGEGSNFVRRYITWIPWVFLISVTLAWFYPVFTLLVIALVIINLLLTQSYSTVVMKTDGLIGKVSRLLNTFSEAMEAIRAEDWKSPLCRELAAGLKDNQHGKLPQQIKQLSVLINQLAFGLSSIGPVLNAVVAWNVRQYFAIEDWKRTNQVNLEAAFDVIADFEALVSLSSLKSNYSYWAFPEIIEGEHYTLSVQAAGHPLIRSDLRVVNDYTLNNELKIDIITGSNMAGKSTFLRTLGINTVLALSGAPVCARQMRVSSMLVFSYMRIKDSLNESTSTFKAELDRLQALLGILKTEDKVFFLIDEMLRGTNSVDKYLGSKAVIEKLIAQEAVGIIATHDLQIAELEAQYPDYIRNFYFDIQIEGMEMRFDYKLKKGECKTFNASILLERLGIYSEVRGPGSGV